MVRAMQGNLRIGSAKQTVLGGGVCVHVYVGVCGVYVCVYTYTNISHQVT